MKVSVAEATTIQIRSALSLDWLWLYWTKQNEKPWNLAHCPTVPYTLLVWTELTTAYRQWTWIRVWSLSIFDPCICKRERWCLGMLHQFMRKRNHSNVTFVNTVHSMYSNGDVTKNVLSVHDKKKPFKCEIWLNIFRKVSMTQHGLSVHEKKKPL